MRIIGLLLVLMVQEPTVPPPAPKPVGTMSQLMVEIIYPTSDDIFYIGRTPPTKDSEWAAVQRSALMLAESANLLMMDGRARDKDKWMKDAKLLLDAGVAAYKAAKAKDMDAVLALNQQLIDSCVTCHADYRSNYRRRPGQQ